jgi:ADP-heptose:LPS heptosyltransferase
VELICAEDIDNFLNLNGLTALMSLCDVVVSVSSATVHFAGAMGIPVLLFDANKLWYWGNKRGQQSLWYPSVKIFPRDSMATPWTRQILRVAHDVRKLRNAK